MVWARVFVAAEAANQDRTRSSRVKPLIMGHFCADLRARVDTCQAPDTDECDCTV